MIHIRRLIKGMIFTMCVCVALTSCTEPHVHNWKAEVTVQPTCEEPGKATKTCTGCGAVEEELIAPNGHRDGVDKLVKKPGCLTPGQIDNVCPDCGKVFSSRETEPAGHKPGTLTMIKAPTCTEGGEEDSVCEVCGERLGHRELPPLGHDVKNSKKEIIVAATCETDGRATLTCPVCNEQFDEVVVQKLGHLWEKTVVTKEATCTEEGREIQYCSRDKDHVRSIIKEKVPHVYEGISTVEKAPTCTEEGSMKTLCKNCDAFILNPIEATGHTMGKSPALVTKEPKDFEEGIGVWKCTVCDYEEQRSIPKLHVHKTINDELSPYDDTNTLNGNEPGTCKTPSKIYAYCVCYVDDEGNHYTEGGEGRHRYKLINPETGEPYYKEGETNPDNHEKIVSHVVEPKGYFLAGVNENVCEYCHAVAGREPIEGDKYSATGLWFGEGPFKSGGQDYVYKLYIAAYPNGMNVFSYILGGNVPVSENQLAYRESDFGSYIAGNLTGQEELLMNTTDGRWISTWDTLYDSMSNQKVFTLVKGNPMGNITVPSDSYEKQTISFNVFSDVAANIKRQELPADKGIVGIKATGLDSLTSFSKNESGADVISIAAGTAVKLYWVPLKDGAPVNAIWTESGASSKTGSEYTLSSSTGTVTVTCSAGSETHTVVLVFR